MQCNVWSCSHYFYLWDFDTSINKETLVVQLFSITVSLMENSEEKNRQMTGDVVKVIVLKLINLI